jgi:hypothetical protein
VAVPARRRHIQRRDRGPRIADAPDAVRTMTVSAGSDTLFTGRHPLAVNARLVLEKLVYTHLRIEPLHISRVAVAGRT